MYGQQVHFQRHEPCPRCNSRDNLARYSSGSAFCFGCGYHEPAKLGPSYGNLSRLETGQAEAAPRHIRPLPDDIVSYYPGHIVNWISQYDLSPVQLISNNIVWSPSREQLIFQFFGEDSEVILWQARNFRAGTTHQHRFFTTGSPENTIAKYSTNEAARVCCLVEDCISALKVSYTGVDGVPCFSSNISRQKLLRLSRIYDTIVVWLDNDKLKESRKISEQAAAIGMTSSVVWTKDDPKYYSLNQIKRHLNI